MPLSPALMAQLAAAGLIPTPGAPSPAPFQVAPPPQAPPPAPPPPPQAPPITYGYTADGRKVPLPGGSAPQGPQRSMGDLLKQYGLGMYGSPPSQLPAAPPPQAAAHAAPAPSADGAVFAAQKPEAQNWTGGAGGAAGVVPAHAVSLVSPESRAMLEKAQADKLAAAGAGEKAEVGANDASADALSSLAGVLEGHRRSMADAEERRRRAMDEQVSDYQKYKRQAAEGRIEPEDTSYMGAIGIGLSKMLGTVPGAAGAALSGQPNHFLQSINQRIDRKVAADRANLDNKWKAAEASQNELGQMHARFGDERIAETALRAKELEKYKAVGDTMVARAQSPMLSAKWAGIRAGIEGEQAAQHAQLEKWQPASLTGGASDDAVRKLAAEMYKAHVGEPGASTESMLNAAARILGRAAPAGEEPNILNRGKAGGGGAAVPSSVPSTNWDPTRVFQGTEAGKAVREQERYNASVLAYAHSQGIRDPEKARTAYKGYVIEPGDSQATANEKLHAFRKLTGGAVPAQDPDALIEAPE